MSLTRWYTDASFAIHDDFKSHSGGAMTLSEAGGAIASGSNKQKIKTHSSTEAELFASDDFLLEIIWTGKLMLEQGYENFSKPFQDNRSPMILKKRVGPLYVSEAVIFMYGFL